MYIFFVCLFLLTVYLMNLLVALLKRKTAIPLKLFQFNQAGKFIIFCCFCYSLYFILYSEENFYIEDLLLVVLLSFIFILLRQGFGYSKAEINSCLEDTDSIGAYWAHQAYDVYYKLVIENIKDRMMLFEKENNINFFFKKLIIIIPLSCNAEGTLTDRDDSIKEFGFLKPIETDQGANVNRTYRNPVFRICEDIYVVAEYSSPVRTLWESRFEMEKEKINYIRDCYIKTLKDLLKGSPGIIVEYDDEANCPKTLSDCILSSIKRERENDYFV